MAHDEVLRFDRRRLLQCSLALAGLGLLTGCGSASFNPFQKKIPRLGFLSFRSLWGSPEVTAFEKTLRDRGYVSGQTIEISYR